jgi:hypothetical protein
MNPSEKFLKYAAECQSMAEVSQSLESKATWSHLAARWIRCAELVARHEAMAAEVRRRAHRDRVAKRHRRPGAEAA